MSSSTLRSVIGKLRKIPAKLRQRLNMTIQHTTQPAGSGTDRQRELRARRRYADGLMDGIASMLKPGDVVCDCGANVGKVTAVLAASGATVHAFEPDPHALEILRKRFADMPNVILHPVAVGDADGSVTFYRMTTHDAHPEKSGQGSTIFADHRSRQKFEMAEILVKKIDFPSFVADLLTNGVNIPFIKLDVEGAELDILRKMLDHGLFDRVRLTVAETHEKQIPALADKFAALRADITARYPKSRVNLDWI